MSPLTSTSISIDVSNGAIYITGNTCIFVGKLARLVSMLQWGRVVTYKGKLDRFSLKCEQCSYGLSGTKCGEEHRWKMAVHNAVRGKTFSPFHTRECTSFGIPLGPPNLLSEIPLGMEIELSTEDLFILRRLGVPFSELKLDRQVLRRSKVATTKWDVEGFITYVLNYNERTPSSFLSSSNTVLNSRSSCRQVEDKLIGVISNSGTTTISIASVGAAGNQPVSTNTNITTGIPLDKSVVSTSTVIINSNVVPSTGSTTSNSPPASISHRNQRIDEGLLEEASPIIIDPPIVLNASRASRAMINNTLQKEEESTLFTYSPVMENSTFIDNREDDTSSPVSYSNLLLDNFESEARSRTTLSLKRKDRSVDSEQSEEFVIHNVNNPLPNATTAANKCIELSYLFPHNSNLRLSFEAQLQQLKSTQCFMATQRQTLRESLQETLEELQSYKNIKVASLAPAKTARTECSICHLMQENVVSSKCSHQFCVDCFIVSTNCPLCPLDSLSSRPLKKARIVLHDVQMFETYMKIVESCASKKTWALMKVAHCYEDGIGVREDFGKALEFYILSADGGNKFAQYRLAQLYEEGVLVLQSVETAKRWYSAAAAQNHAGAQGMLCTDPNMGCNHLFNHIISEECEYKCDSFDCELKFYEFCSEIGNYEASRYIGECYLNGTGLMDEICYPEAVKYLELAHDQGDKSVEALLWYAKGLMHYYAEGVGRFVEGASRCFYEAAVVGHRLGMERYLLCIMPALEGAAMSQEKIATVNDVDLMKIVQHFGKEEMNQKEYLEIYFRAESRGRPNITAPIQVAKQVEEKYDDRIIRIQRCFAKNYKCRKALLGS